MNGQKKEEHRISGPTAVSMVGTAILFDLASLIPIVNIVIVPAGLLAFWMWFQMHGVSIGFTSPKRLATMSLTGLAEIIPAISMIPSWTAGVMITILLTTIEDKTGVKIPLGKPKAATAAAK